MQKFVTNSENETENLAMEIAKSIPKGSVVELIGDLGAGKTAFSKGFAKGLGVKETVTSPTFALLNTYTGDDVRLNHFDLYRVCDIEELDLMGFREVFFENDAISLIEWPQIASDYLPKSKHIITITKTGDNSREITWENV